MPLLSGLEVGARKARGQSCWSIGRGCLAVVAVVFAHLGVPLALGAAPQVRGLSRDMDDTAVPGYRGQWAVIVGINYAHLQGAARAEVPALKTAENDAQAVYDQLTAHYGYRPETSRLLKGAEATRDNIRRLFGDAFLGDGERVSAEDAVIFYFAGHGNRRETTAARDQYVGLLYPYDVQVLPGKGVDTISCLRIDELLGYLRDYCAARHKLVILDSCHSGEVFNFRAHRSAGVNRGFRANLFRQPAFQAIAAARGSQTAADADESGQHSPVTRALLDALTSGPRGGDRTLFTASELFSFIPGRVAEMPGVQQDPRGGWIAGEGDFYFFPETLKASDLPERELAAVTATARRDIAEPRAAGSGDGLPSAGRRWPPVMLLVAGGVVLLAFGGLVGWRRWRRKPADDPGALGTGSSTRAAEPVAAPSAGGPILCLRLLGTPCLYQAVPGAERVRVGRQRRKPGEGLDQGNDFVIRSPAGDEQSLRISRQHFEIRRVGSGYQIVDHSTAGTSVNGERLTKDEPHPLHAGDKVTVAEVITLEVLLVTAAVRGGVQAELTAQGPGGAGPLLLHASVGDMITAEEG